MLLTSLNEWLRPCALGGWHRGQESYRTCHNSKGLLCSKVSWVRIPGKEKARHRLRRKCRKGKRWEGNQRGQMNNKKTKEGEHSVVQKRCRIISKLGFGFRQRFLQGAGSPCRGQNTDVESPIKRPCSRRAREAGLELSG